MNDPHAYRRALRDRDAIVDGILVALDAIRGARRRLAQHPHPQRTLIGGALTIAARALLLAFRWL